MDEMESQLRESVVGEERVYWGHEADSSLFQITNY